MDFPSINDVNISPLETGGIVARDGFDFQDHVAARFCLEMLDDPSLHEVWCETQDDITLIWETKEGRKNEFIQVKGNKLDQLWSLALLCQKEKKQETNSAPASIYEKLLANDRFSEKSLFRIVTRMEVKKELRLLKTPINSPARNPEGDGYKALCEGINNYSGAFCSPKDNGSEYWVSNTLWDAEYSTDVLEDKNLEKLREYLDSRISEYVPRSQAEKIYQEILMKVKRAALEQWNNKPDDKKIKRDDFETWLNMKIVDQVTGSLTGVGKRMQVKMKAAKLPDDYILTAHQERRMYRKESLSPQYLETSDREWYEGEITASLLQLRAELDSGSDFSSGVEFHGRCLKKIKEIRDSTNAKTRPNLGLLQGYMYYITGRCFHRFMKVKE